MKPKNKGNVLKFSFFMFWWWFFMAVAAFFFGNYKVCGALLITSYFFKLIHYFIIVQQMTAHATAFTMFLQEVDKEYKKAKDSDGQTYKEYVNGKVIRVKGKKL